MMNVFWVRVCVYYWNSRYGQKSFLPNVKNVFNFMNRGLGFFLFLFTSPPDFASHFLHLPVSLSVCLRLGVCVTSVSSFLSHQLPIHISVTPTSSCFCPLLLFLFFFFKPASSSPLPALILLSSLSVALGCTIPVSFPLLSPWCSVGHHGNYQANGRCRIHGCIQGVRLWRYRRRYVKRVWQQHGQAAYY